MRVSREYFNGAKQPLQKIQAEEKNLKCLPFPTWQAQLTLGDTLYDYQWYFLAQQFIY